MTDLYNDNQHKTEQNKAQPHKVQQNEMRQDDKQQDKIQQYNKQKYNKQKDHTIQATQGHGSSSLPVDELIPALTEHLQDKGVAVLIAEPGAGKTTRIPLALMKASWLDGWRIVMLEPRRLAAISAARYMAATLGEKVGQTVGYRVALDTRVSAATRIEVVTEGVLTRMLQHDPSLEGIGLVIFDEFHERNLNADLGLAFTLESRSLLRDDLRVLVMSATMEPEPVAQLLGEAPILRSGGRTYPVETYYEAGESVFTLYRKRGAPIQAKIVNVIHKALHKHDGELLVFLPGIREIRRVQHELLSAKQPLPAGVEVVILHGGLKAEQQDEAVRVRTDGTRRIILSTSLAESSVTIEGVTIVIDSGLMRTRVFSPTTGMERMETRQVSIDAADQRRGRAGRQRPGVCYRLWSAEEHRILPAERKPEILQSDLAPLALEVAAWGRDVQEMAWLTSPPEAAYREGQRLLQQLEALDEQLRMTTHGRHMTVIGAHPRLAHMIIKGGGLGGIAEACDLAALLQERDILPPAAGIELVERMRALYGQSKHRVESAAVQRIKEWSERFARQWHELELAKDGKTLTKDAVVKKSLFASEQHSKEHPEQSLKQQSSIKEQYSKEQSLKEQLSSSTSWIGALLSFAYPDRIGQNRGDGRFLLRLGRGALLPTGSGGTHLLAGAPYIVAAELEDSGSDSRILLAAELQEDILQQLHAASITDRTEVTYDAEREAIRAQKVQRLGAIVLRAVNDAAPSVEAIRIALMEALQAHPRGLDWFNWTKPAVQLRQRMALMHVLQPEHYPAVDDAALLSRAEDWLLPYMGDIRRLSELRRLSVNELLLSMLDWQQRQEMEQMAPTHITVPSGSRIPIDYSDPAQPFIAVRLQEMFGCTSTPLLGGRIPLTIQLLSPANRPVQVTRDLASFWANTYFEVKKDLKGRYPKHYWPDDPLQAQATNRTKPRQS
ncbi:ATP-dependent helicase HrpB [Paenibacillus wenxiniae]|uniref:ATP-dependent helicase HrpB n=1 Tax=Paenibacillus wenxiniae TaxID=1636843 RepID=A0ABW4RQ42_9BACL